MSKSHPKRPHLIESKASTTMPKFTPRTGTATDGDEVPIIPPPRKISKIVPDYFTVKLPYYVNFNFSVASANIAYANSYSQYIRCNSIYDPIIGSISNEQPQGRDTWAGLFAYYRVLSSSIHVRFLNMNPSEVIVRETSSDPAPTTAQGYGDPRNGEYMVGYEMTDSTSATLSNNQSMFMCTKHAKRVLLPAAPTMISNDESSRYVPRYSSATVSYDYAPGNWDYHVQETGVEERWTPIKQNPTNDHVLALRAFHKGSDPLSQKDAGIYCEVYIEYTVQFRETAASLIKTLETSDATYNNPGEDAADTT